MANVYQMVTDRIIEQMKQGIIPWHKPWVGAEGEAINYESRKPYSLLNQFLLGEPGEYITWKQIQARKGKVKKGAKSRFVVFYQMNKEIKKDPETGEEKTETYPILKWYSVFRLADVEGIDSKIVPTVANLENDPIESADLIVAGYLQREDKLRFYNNQSSPSAYYSRTNDEIHVPMLSQFESSEEYYSTTFHELVHSTMLKSRCDRITDMDIQVFGDNDYSKEELVAEIGSAMLCNLAGIDSEKAFKNSIAYIQNWLKALKDDPKMIIWAAARAEKAVKFILNQTEEALPQAA